MSVFFILLVTFERYMAVCHPLRVKILSSPSRVMIATICTTILSFVLNSMRWFEFKIVVMNQSETCSNDTIVYIPLTTELRQNRTYEKYIFLNYIILNWLLPVSTILIMNTLIFRTVS